MRGLKKIVLTAVLCAIACTATLAFTAVAESTKATKITVDINYGDYNGFALPAGRVGKSYPVFGCTATDDLGEEVKSVRITVKNPDGQVVTVNNGRFDTLTAGEYTIEYFAESGILSASKTIKVTVDDTATDPYYEISKSVPAESLTGYAVTAENGTYGGGVGDLTVETSLNLGEEAIDLIENENGYYFIPEKSGDYVLTYKVTDFVNASVAVSKTITVEDSLFPLLEKPSVPQTAIEGETLVLPLVDGVLYKDGAKYYLPVKVYCGETEVTQSMKVENLVAGERTIKYECVNPADSTKKTEYAFAVKVNAKAVEDDGLLFDKYFAYDNFESFKGENGEYKVKAISGAKQASFAFSRALPLDYLNFGITAVTGKTNYSALNMVLTDSRNAGDSVKVKIKRLASYDNLYVHYDDTDKTIKTVQEEVIAEIRSYADGRTFDGFKSGSAFVSFEVENIRGAVEFTLTNVGSNNITTDGQDFAPPIMLGDADFKTIFVSYIGRKVYLPEIKAFDLLDANPTVTLKVTAPDKTVVYNGTGAYTLEVTQSGTYRVEYVATDDNYNSTRKTATVYALDVESPVIKVSGIKSTAKVGEELTLPKAEITDNATATEEITSYVYVLRGDNRKELVGETYTFKEAGEYIIRFVAYDSNQNYTVTEFTVICK